GLPSDGAYTVEATSFFDNETGEYRITLLAGENITPDRTVTEISYRSTKIGSLTEGEGTSRRRIEFLADDYIFTGNAGDSVVIDLMSSDFDTYLYLYDPEGRLVADNDDYGGITRSFIEYAISSNGVYAIEVTSYDQTGRGEYQIILLANEDIFPERSTTELFYGWSMDGSLSALDGKSHRRSRALADDYTFTGSSGDSVIIDLTSSVFDTYLHLYDPEGGLVAENDDYGSTSRSYIWYRLTSSGTHTIEVTSYGGNEVGIYQITLLGNENVKPGRSTTEISYGDSIAGSFNVTDGTSRFIRGSYADNYTFTGSSGDTVGIGLTSREFDTFLFLFDQEGEVAAYNDDWGGTSRSYIWYILGKDGTYTVEVASYNENTTGEYTITLSTGVGETGYDRSFRKISYGAEIDDILSASDQFSRRREETYSDDYRFSGTSGDTVVIDLTSSVFDTFLYLFNPNCNLVASNDDYDGTSRSMIEYELPYSGTYTVEVTSYFPEQTGPYKLLLNNGSGSVSETILTYGAALSTTLSSTDSISLLNTGSYADNYSFTASTGDSVCIDMSSSDFNPCLYLIDWKGEILAIGGDNTDRSVSRISYQFRSSGSFRIEATTHQPEQTGNYSLTLIPAHVFLFSADAGEQFTSLRRGWGLDLTWPDDIDKNTFRSGLPWNINMDYQQSDSLPGSNESELVVMGFDKVSNTWVRQNVTSHDLNNNTFT
ncbi:PPC domain-containing protein, partial [Gemmatimonadota bacterium]